MCPNCQSSLLSTTRLNAHLEGKKCSSCGGIWIPGYNYAKYLEHKSDFQRSSPAPHPKDRGEDSQDGKKCPDCGKAVIARSVGHGLDFRVERCDGCFGIWLDRGEWESLSEKSLQDRINRVFSSYWQGSVAVEKRESLKEERLAEILGQERGKIVADFKKWLNAQDEKETIKSYL